VRKKINRSWETFWISCYWQRIWKNVSHGESRLRLVLQREGGKELYKIAKGDRYRYLPFIAFEVPYYEKQKALRGSLVTLQLTNASASIIVLLGKSVEYESYLKKLIGRYSFVRYRIWTEKNVDELYDKIKQNDAKKDI